jgi:tryptophanyl-tRNA synthetase
VPNQKLDEIIPACRSAAIGCVECKKILSDCINQQLAPYRAKRDELAADPGFVADLLADGSRRAGAVAAETMLQVRDALKV